MWKCIPALALALGAAIAVSPTAAADELAASTKRVARAVRVDEPPAIDGLLDDPAWRDIVTYRDDLGHERVVHARRRPEEEPRGA